MFSKVSMPNLVTYLHWTPMFECWVVRCKSKNKYHKDMSLKEINRLRTQNLLTMLDSIVNIFEGTYVTLVFMAHSR